MRPDVLSWMQIPYVAGGRSAAGADCWGLVRIVRHALRGDVLPLYSAVGNKGSDDLPAALDDFLRLAVPATPADGVLAGVFAGERFEHVGICITLSGRLHVLDTSSEHGPACIPLTRFERLYGNGNVRYYDY